MKWAMMLLALCLVVGSVSAIPLLTEYDSTTSNYINITTSMGVQTDYQIKYILSNASGISGYYAPDNIVFTNGTTRPDWYDINATDLADTPLPFWIENNTATAYNATVWVKVPTIAVDNSSGLKWRYGNASQAESTMNGLNTFPTFTDWNNAAINATQFTIQPNGGNTISNGVLTISGSGSSQLYGVIGTTAYNQNYSVVTRSDFNTVATSGNLGLGWEVSNASVPGVSSNYV
jgi:hypothetical protein